MADQEEQQQQGPSGVRTENEIVGGTSLYIGNLPYSLRWQGLKDLFKQAGEVVYADIPRDGFRSRGFGVVRYKTVEEAQKAVDLFNNFELNGRIINVREDKNPRPDFFNRSPAKQSDGAANSGRRSGNGAVAQAKKPSSSSEAEPGCQVFVGNLPWSVTWQSLKDLARDKAGLSPVRSEVAIGFNGQSRGWGTLLFGTPEEANSAIELLNNVEVGGRNIEVRLDRK